MIRNKPVFSVPKNHSVEDPYALSKIENIFRHKRGWIFKMPKEGEAVILLLSGGLDSISLWNLLMDKYKLHVYPLHFTHPERRKKGEEKSIRIFSNIFSKKYPTLFHEAFMKEYRFSFTLDFVEKKEEVWWNIPDIVSNLIDYRDIQNRIKMPVLVRNPSRLGIYSFGAFEYAYFLKFHKKVAANTLFLGMTPEDSKSLRECSLALLRNMNLSLCLLFGNFNWQLTAPLERKYGFYATRKSMVKNAIKKGLPLEHTWSCGNNFSIHCNRCGNCMGRQEIFRQLKFRDKTSYQKKLPLSLVARNKLKNLKNFISRISQSSSVAKKNGKEKLSSQIIMSLKVTPHSSVRWHEINDSVYVLNTETGVIEKLNRSASFIWKEIVKNSGSTPHQLLAILMKKYHVLKKSQAEKDLVVFLKTYIKKGYLSSR